MINFCSTVPTFCGEHFVGQYFMRKSLVLTMQVFFLIGFTAYLKKSLTYKDWSTQCAMYSPELQGAPFTSMELGEDRIVSFNFQWYWSTSSSLTFLCNIFLAFSAHEALCILSLNIIIDKVYLVLWFWFVVVALLGIIRVFCRPVQFVSGTIRFHMMKIKMQRWVGYSMNIILKFHIH